MLTTHKLNDMAKLRVWILENWIWPQISCECQLPGVPVSVTDMDSGFVKGAISLKRLT